MPLKITGFTRIHGPGCEHYTVTVDHEGIVRQFETSKQGIDESGDEILADDMKKMVISWARYRRRQGRPILNVEIA